MLRIRLRAAELTFTRLAIILPHSHQHRGRCGRGTSMLAERTAISVLSAARDAEEFVDVLWRIRFVTLKRKGTNKDTFARHAVVVRRAAVDFSLCAAAREYSGAGACPTPFNVYRIGGEVRLKCGIRDEAAMAGVAVEMNFGQVGGEESGLGSGEARAAEDAGEAVGCGEVVGEAVCGVETLGAGMTVVMEAVEYVLV
jgi:hypothetical protein